MLRFAPWKVASIVGMSLIALLIVIPSMLSPQARSALQSRMPSWLPAKTITLGLDLQGGSHILLEVDSPAVVRTQVENLRDDVRRILREERVGVVGGIAMQARGVQFRLANPGELPKALPKIRTLGQSSGAALLGAAGAPGVEVNSTENGVVQVTVTEAGVQEKVRRAVDQSIEVLRRRIDGSGMKEPTIQRQGADRILVQVPGLQDPQQLKDLLGTTAKLEFRLVGQPGDNPADIEELDQTEGGKIPVEKQVMVQGEDLTDAQPGFDQRNGEPVVNFRFNLRGGLRRASPP